MTDNKISKVLEERTLIEDQEKNRKNDLLSKMIEEEEEELVKEARRLKLLEFIEMRRQRLRELQEKTDGSEKEKPKEGVDIQELVPWAMELSKMPEDQRLKVIEIVRALKAAEKAGEASGLAYLIPLAMGITKSNPEKSPTEVVELVKAVGEQYKLGMETAKLMQPQQQTNQHSIDVVALVKTIADVFKENIQKPLEELPEKIRPAPHFLEQILKDDTLFQRAKEVGLFGGSREPASTNPEVQIKLKELETMTQRELKKMEYDLEKWKTEQQLELAKWQQIGSILSGPLGTMVEKVGGAAIASASQSPTQAITVETTNCPTCKRQFYVEKSAMKTVCPHCGAVLQRLTQQAPPTTEGQGVEPRAET